MDWEIRIIETLQTLLGSSSAGVGIATCFTWIGEELVLVGLLGFLYWSYDKKWGVFFGTNMLGALISNCVLKNVIMRARPYMEHESIRCIRPSETDADPYDIAAQGYSFPSGHAQNSVTAFGSLRAYRKNRILTVLMIVIPLFVGISRIVLGVHYPTDILAGWFLGAATVLILGWLQMHVKRRWLLHLVLFLLGICGCFFCRSADYFTSIGMMAGFFLAVPFEEKYVRFQNTDSLIWRIVRVIVGLGLFVCLNTILKLPFSEEFLDSATAASFAVRAVRYAIVIFLLLGVYPLAFRLEKKGRKN